MSTPSNIVERLEYLRGELRSEIISYGELAELQGLARYIEPGDVELLEAAGVPEDWRAPSTNDTLIAGQHPHIVAEMMSDTASDADAATLLGLLAADGYIGPDATIGNLNALYDDTFYAYAYTAECNQR